MSTQMSPASTLTAASLFAPGNPEEGTTMSAGQHVVELKESESQARAARIRPQGATVPRVPSPLANSLGAPGGMSPVVPCVPNDAGSCAVQRAMDVPRPTLAQARSYAQGWMDDVARADSEAAAAGVGMQRQPGLTGPWTIVRALWSLRSRNYIDATEPEHNTLLRKALWQAFIADLRAASGLPRRLLLRDSDALYVMALLFRWTAVRTMRIDHAPFRKGAMPLIEVVIAHDIAALEAAERAAQAAAPSAVAPSAVPPAASPAVDSDADENGTDPMKRCATNECHERSMLDPQGGSSSTPHGRYVQSSNTSKPTQRSHAPSGEQTEEPVPLDDGPTESDHRFDNGDEAQAD